MTMLGMNTESVRSMATQLDTSAGDIEGMITRLTGLLGGVEWNGPDAASFRSDWEGGHVTALRNVIAALNAAAARARSNADQQDQASAV